MLNGYDTTERIFRKYGISNGYEALSDTETAAGPPERPTHSRANGRICVHCTWFHATTVHWVTGRSRSL